MFMYLSFMLTVMSIFIMAAYVAGVCIEIKGVPPSISATFFKLKHRFWFTATMWSVSLLLVYPIIMVSKPHTTIAAIIAMVGLFLVGAAPNFTDKHQRKIHISGATSSLIGSQIWVGLNLPLLLLAWSAYILYTIIAMSVQKQGSFTVRFLRTNPLFWIEILSLSTTYATIFIKLFE